MMNDALIPYSRVLSGSMSSLWFRCPACNTVHQVLNVASWNHNKRKPTFREAFLCKRDNSICNIIISDGVLHYTNVCTHEYRGKSVPMVDM